MSHHNYTHHILNRHILCAHDNEDVFNISAIVKVPLKVNTYDGSSKIEAGHSGFTPSLERIYSSPDALQSFTEAGNKFARKTF